MPKPVEAPSAHEDIEAPGIDIPANDPGRVAEVIDALETDNMRLKDTIKEERFRWVFIIILVVDAALFAHMPNWAGPVCLSILEVFFLLYLGRISGVEDIASLLDKLLYFYASHRRGKTPSEW